MKCFIVPLRSVADKGYILITACFSLMLSLLYCCRRVHMNVLFPVIMKIILVLSRVVAHSVGIASVSFLDSAGCCVLI